MLKVKGTEEMISAYETDVEFDDVSGMELLDMLYVRSDLFKYMDDMDDAQRYRVRQADQILLKKARAIQAAIERIADISAWRRHEKFPVTHWWWYLDVVAEVPYTLEFNASANQQGLMVG